MKNKLIILLIVLSTSLLINCGRSADGLIDPKLETEGIVETSLDSFLSKVTKDDQKFSEKFSVCEIVNSQALDLQNHPVQSISFIWRTKKGDSISEDDRISVCWYENDGESIVQRFISYNLCYCTYGVPKEWILQGYTIVDESIELYSKKLSSVQINYIALINDNVYCCFYVYEDCESHGSIVSQMVENIKKIRAIILE